MKKLIAGIVIALYQIIYIIICLRRFFAFYEAGSGMYYIFISFALYATLILFIARIILWFVKPNNKFYWLYFVGMILAVIGAVKYSSYYYQAELYYFTQGILTVFAFTFLLPIADSFITDFVKERSPSAQTQKQKEIERLKEKIKKLEE